MGTRVLLPEEAPDMTATELHEAVLFRLFGALLAVFGDRALVLGEIFLRTGGDYVGEGEQYSADLMVVPGGERGRRRVYRWPDEPAPAVTLEILSVANYRGAGREQLLRKREFYGRIGVATHIEIDPDRGEIVEWKGEDGRLRPVGPASDRYDGNALGGLTIEAEPGDVRVWMPDGREYLDAGAETARADWEAARANGEAARADEEAARAAAESARADRYLRLLRERGIDPDAG